MSEEKTVSIPWVDPNFDEAKYKNRLGFLTDEEFEALDHLTAFAKSAFMKSLGENDLREAVDKIHQLQSMVMSQAACRAYPDRFRLL